MKLVNRIVERNIPSDLYVMEIHGVFVYIINCDIELETKEEVMKIIHKLEAAKNEDQEGHKNFSSQSEHMF